MPGLQRAKLENIPPERSVLWHWRYSLEALREPTVTDHTERCEWNPVLHQPAFDPPRPTDCRNVTSVCIGANGTWHVCASCAEDPVFKRFTKRTPLPALRRNCNQESK